MGGPVYDCWSVGTVKHNSTQMLHVCNIIFTYIYSPTFTPKMAPNVGKTFPYMEHLGYSKSLLYGRHW